MLKLREIMSTGRLIGVAVSRLVRRVAAMQKPAATSSEELGSGTAETRKAKSELVLVTVPLVEIFR